jgi:hypothetical protein
LLRSITARRSPKAILKEVVENPQVIRAYLDRVTFTHRPEEVVIELRRQRVLRQRSRDRRSPSMFGSGEAVGLLVQTARAKAQPCALSLAL